MEQNIYRAIEKLYRPFLYFSVPIKETNECTKDLPAKMNVTKEYVKTI